MNYEDRDEFDHLRWQATPDQVRSANGRRKIGSLFLETIRPQQLKRYGPIYTLAEKPQYDSYWERWLPSAKQIYVLSDNEYEAALKLVCSIEHWNMLVENSWFVDGTDDYSWTSLSQWRKEQQDRKLSLAEGALMKQALKGNVAAIKTLLGQSSQKRGRPSKEEVEGAKRKAAGVSDEYEEDRARVLHLVRDRTKEAS